ncbi:MAG: tyrosine--tRNA ligase [Bacilli bacterium]|nr:tyrosine--tRNA ligase [Bacilli bacterium]
MKLYDELVWRGLIHSVTDDAVIEKMNNGELTFYLGADPTGDSLHVGHLLVYLFAKRLEMAGNKPIFLIGGATGSIGDPKPGSERQLLSKETTLHNAKCLHEQVLRLFNCEMVNNYDWTSCLDILTFLRTYGKFFNVNYMINKETVKARLDSGISYAEFSYQILQALDFEYLYSHKGCKLQIGGQDQWGNITGGLELIRKMHEGEQTEAYGVTVPLVLKSDGTKFGKSESGAVWLDENKTTPYAFYQFWINTPDSDVIKRLKQFTFLSVEEIQELEESFSKEPHLRKAQKALAKEVTTLIHGEESCQKAINLTEALFSGRVGSLTKEEIEMGFDGVTKVVVEGDINIIDAVMAVKAASSKREAREFINNGAVSINGVQEKSLEKVLTKEEALGNKYIIIRRGKKNYYLLEF